MKADLAGAWFVCDLRRALQHLYDPAELSKSPLVSLLGVRWQRDPATQLQRLLLGAVAALKPAPEVPPQASAWRIYHTLNRRYVEQIPQRDIADSLALSVRQLRRQEAIALRVLADHLWVSQGVQYRADVGSAPPAGDAAEAPPNPPEATSREREVERLSESFPSELATVEQVVQGSLETIAPLLRAMHVHADCALPPDLPQLAVQSIPTRQALVNLLSVAVRSAPGGQIEIEAKAANGQVCLSILPRRGRAAALPLDADDSENLDLARRFIALSGGSLQVALDGGPEQPFSAALLLPAAQQLAVLAIDDNADALQLLQRYLEGTPYPFIGVRDPLQALAVARDLQPRAIVLDVMLPGMDGWELLGRMREHPATRRIPIIVCTILPHERLALTLGAAAFLRKPVNRGELLDTLQQLR
ncbi:MAG: response regulator [Anaerolineae bacterium]